MFKGTAPLMTIACFTGRTRQKPSLEWGLPTVAGAASPEICAGGAYNQAELMGFLLRMIHNRTTICVQFVIGGLCDMVRGRVK